MERLLCHDHTYRQLVNIILDPIMIFGLRFPGVKGAAIATVIGQTCGFMAAVGFNMEEP